MLSHPIVMQELARARNDDLLREAMRYRLAAGSGTKFRLGERLTFRRVSAYQRQAPQSSS